VERQPQDGDDARGVATPLKKEPYEKDAFGEMCVEKTFANGNLK